MILGWLGSLLGGPFVQGALDAYRAKLASGNNAEKIAADLAAQKAAIDEQSQALQTQIIIAEQGRWWTAMPRFLIELSVAVYIAKLVLDKVLGFGFTDPPGTTFGNVMQIVLVGLFGSYTVVGAVRAWRAKS